MTAEQHRLYVAALRIGRAFGTGGFTWAGIRATGGTPSADATVNALDLANGYFIENNLISRAVSLPDIAIYRALWWWVTGISTDIQANDVRSNGAIAFLITGTPDTSQGFNIAPAAPTALPANHVGAAFQAGLRIGAW